jgi:hypothetical protein
VLRLLNGNAWPTFTASRETGRPSWSWATSDESSEAEARPHRCLRPRLHTPLARGLCGSSKRWLPWATTFASACSIRPSRHREGALGRLLPGCSAGATRKPGTCYCKRSASIGLPHGCHRVPSKMHGPAHEPARSLHFGGIQRNACTQSRRLITRRSQVQILPPLLREGPASQGLFAEEGT